MPAFGSLEHMDWLVRRLRKNQEFRRLVEAGERRALAAYRSEMAS